MKELIITLTRQKTIGKALIGKVTFPYGNETVTTDSIENVDFQIPAGIYPLDLTWSPKFKKTLPLIMDVPEREGIRIHTGTKPEHSTGCVLVNMKAVMMIKGLLTAIDKKNSENENEEDDEKVLISIIDPVSA